MGKKFFSIIIVMFVICCYVKFPSAFALDICTLDENIQSYQERRIRVSAFITEGFEYSFLYDPQCQEGKPLLHFELTSKIDGKVKAFKKLIKKKGYAFVTIEGIVHGPEPIPVDPKIEDRVKELYGGIMPVKTYGHFNAYKMSIAIDNIIEVKNIDDGMQ